MAMVHEGLAREPVEDLQRLERMRLAWRAYYGDTPRPLRVRPGEVDDTVRLNFARLVVDKGVSHLMGAGVGFRVEEGGDAQVWLDAVLAANRKATLLHKLAVNGGVCGHAWVRVFAGQAAGGLPRLVPLDPERVSVTWAADDFERVLEYRLDWRGRDPVTGRPTERRQLIARGLDGAWTVTDEARESGTGAWRELGRERWPWDWPPVAGCQNLPAPNEYWGISDLEGDLLDVCRAIDFVMSSISRVLRYHAHPRLWARLVGAGDLQTDVDGTIYLPTKDSEIGALEMQSDLGSSLAFYRALREALHEMARIPEAATGKVEQVGALSGTALRILYQPLVEKTQTKRLLYGDLLTDLASRVLEMGGYAGRRAVLRWPRLL